MTEAEWLGCDWFSAMLGYLVHKGSDRQFRLFAVACCRRIWMQISDERSRAAVEVAERFADGDANKQDLREARLAAAAPFRERRFSRRQRGLYWALNAARCTVADQSWDAGREASWASAWASNPLGPNAPDECREQALLVREVFGNPFARPLGSRVPSPWLTATILQQAQSVYVEQRIDAFPDLALLLERTGCDDDGLLAHLRVEATHCRGCWALDLLTGRS